MYMRIILMILFILWVLTKSADARPLVVAVIDTGYDFSNRYEQNPEYAPVLCKYGHKNFVDNDEILPQDRHGHGSHIITTIAKGNQKKDYCIVVIKALDPFRSGSRDSDLLNAYQYALNIKPDIINLSISGLRESEEECLIIRQMIRKGIKVVAAAGNNKLDLIKNNVYPAMCHKDVYKITNIDNNTNKLYKNSNYVSIEGVIPKVEKMSGINVEAISLKSKKIKFNGTSQAAANFTNGLIKILGKNRHE